MSAPNPYAGKRYTELCGMRRDYAKMLHAAVAARKVAERNLNLIADALRDAAEPKPYEASDHSVIRYLERVEGVDVSAIRDTITLNCEQGKELIGDKLRGHDGYLYCVNGDGFVTTILPLDAVVDEATEREAAMRERPHPNGQKRRGMRAKRDFVASAMSAFGQDPEEGLEAKPASATAESGDAQTVPSPSSRERK